MSDDAFIQATLAAPADEAVRLIYADWLDERADLRGPFLRAEVALATVGLDDPRRGERQARLREAATGIDPVWLATVSRAPIENCGVSFRFRCPKRWEQLKPTADGSVRFCEGCRQRVFFCHTIAVAQTHAAVGECVAVDPRLARRTGDLESDVWELEPVMGLPTPEELQPAPKEEEPPRQVPGRRRRR